MPGPVSDSYGGPDVGVIQSRNYTDEQINELAHDLLGTCESLEEALRRLYSNENDLYLELTVADCQALDAEIFCCGQCSWWEETSQESAESGVCIDCHSGDDDD